MAVTLVLFCKKPGPGIGKQRLARSLGTETAWRIAELLHRCALEQLRSWPGPKVLATADRADLGWYRSAFPWIDRVLVQPKGNLGQRINRIDRMLRAGGCRGQIIIGSDMPEQTPEMLREAAALLQRQEVVLSPAEDGGVTLMASRSPWPDLADLPWSTSELGRALADLCTGAGLEVGTMTPCADVDEWADLERLRTTLATDRREPQQALHKLIRELLR